MGGFLSVSGVAMLNQNKRFLERYRDIQLEHVAETLKDLRDVYPSDDVLDWEKFDEIFGFVLDDPEPDYNFWRKIIKPPNDNKVPVYPCLASMAAFSKGKMEDKLKFIFWLFDFDSSGYLCKDEVTILLRSSIKGLRYLASGHRDKVGFQAETLKKLVEEIFYSMDADESGTISSLEFKQYVMSTRDVLQFIHTFSDQKDIEKSAEEHKKRWTALEKTFLEKSKVNGHQTNMAPLAFAMELLTKPGNAIQTGKAIDSDERVAIADHIDTQSQVSNIVFEAIARGLIAFDIYDEHKDNYVHLVDLANLVHIKSWVEPDPELLANASKQMGDHNDDDDRITRLEWINFCAPVRPKDGGYYETFSSTVKALFKEHDTDGSGTLELPEFEKLLYDCMLSIFPSSMKHLIVDDDTSKDSSSSSSSSSSQQSLKPMLVRYSKALAFEIFQEAKLNVNSSLEWSMLKLYLNYLWQRQEEMIQWFYDHQTDHFARIFGFDTDDSGHLEEKELQEVLRSSLNSAVEYNILTKAEANDIAKKYAKKVSQAIDLDGDNLIHMNELKQSIEKYLALEKQMLNEVDQKRKAHMKASDYARKKEARIAREQAQKRADMKKAQEERENEPAVEDSTILPSNVVFASRDELPAPAANLDPLVNPNSTNTTPEPSKPKSKVKKGNKKGNKGKGDKGKGGKGKLGKRRK